MTIQAVGCRFFFLDLPLRMPLKFGRETVTEVTCCRVALRVKGSDGSFAVGWGETPLIPQWAWPSSLSYFERLTRMKELCGLLTEVLPLSEAKGDVIEVGHIWLRDVLPKTLQSVNGRYGSQEPMPWLAALLCLSPFDVALHDGWGRLFSRPTYLCYQPPFLEKDLSCFLEPFRWALELVHSERSLPQNEPSPFVSFRNRFPADFLDLDPPRRLMAWHLVGARDPLCPEDLTGEEPDDGYPVLLRHWIERDGLKCLKVKLLGTDWEWDYQRLTQVGKIAQQTGVLWLSADFNCTVQEPDYVRHFLLRLMTEEPEIYQKLLYIEQPFPYDLEENLIDVHSLSSLKPIFMDESAHDWRYVRLGKQLGWNGVALKTCKTQTGALLSLCWARAYGMAIMVQDLTNPMLAQIAHLLLAAHSRTLMGVETNSMQFYPEGSSYEAQVHPGIYRRRDGCVDLTTLTGPGLGYRLEEINRPLPEPAGVFGRWS
ncbi:MAG: hypothetical protein NZ959_09005 [Armatimonadetes bacterium]|nr:hypothetical protein [Armatimonadota bacterium]MDW8122470.1 enolase C-terminal domain-like protein [Armatimonadota bacterium]